MELITFNLSSAHLCGTAFHDFLALRKRHFVDTLNWDIPHDDAVEMDQYDTPLAWYSCVRLKDKIIGGARIMPTNARWGAHGYMLGDAYQGRIPGIPRTALPHMIQKRSVWECTRLVIDPSLADPTARSFCLELICNGLVGIAQSHGASELITLTRLPLMRTLRGLGFDVSLIGRPYVSEEDRHTYAVMGMPAIMSRPALAAE
ncbi:acyl-homoserine-lactone synthase [Shimia ponticola]|uniref:acyl-homoserine-lactone synthase n=1 Tax=Shimia ponticola TaxID=2582893 RepID=UPI0011BF879E|nr:acyl-homoserine-lactone synthase [Shimia ponticola]